MILNISHRLSFVYDRPVYVEPTIVRLRPRCDAAQALRRHEFIVDPPPAGQSGAIDAAGNNVTVLWFAGLQSHLTIEAASEVHTTRSNPFDYLVTDPAALELPVRCGEPDASLLAPYRHRASSHPSIEALAADLLKVSNGGTTDFLARLAGFVHDHCVTVLRPRGAPRSPHRTLALRKGACRDLAVLFMDTCRAVGLAARFVSGYAHGLTPRGTPDLHAWAEVYLPGAGWRGYDPSLGLAVADAHVALAAAPEPAGAAPTSGTFRGTDARARLRFKLRIEVVD